MYSTGTASPSELTAMTEALSAYCLAKGIAEGTPEYDDVGQQVVALFNMGWETKAEIVAMLETPQRSDRKRPSMSSMSPGAFPVMGAQKSTRGP